MFSLFAQVKYKDYIINHQLYNLEDGLAAREVYSGLQDGKGFIWFATRNGLNRFDGKRFQLYTKQYYAMQENNIAKLASDNKNQLFILYNIPGYSRVAGGRVDVFNQTTGQFTSLTATFKNLPFKENNVYWITNDGDNKVQFLTMNPYQLWQYDTQTGFALRCQMKEWNTGPQKYSDFTGPFTYFYKDIALMGIGGPAPFYYLQNQKEYKIYSTPNGSYRVISLANKKNIVLHRKDVNEDSKELYVMNANGQFINNISYAKQLKDFLGKSSPNNIPMPVAGDTTGLLHVPGKAIFLFYNGEFIKILDSQQVEDFSNITLNESFKDGLGNIWICTSVGVYKIKIQKNTFTIYFSKEQQKIESNNQARGILVHDNGAIYTNIWKSIFIQQDEKTLVIKGNEIMYPLFKHANKTYSAGYNLFEINHSNYSLNTIKRAHTGRDILCALSLNDSILLFGKMEGVFSFNIRSGNIKLLTAVKNVKGISMPYRLMKRTDGSIWVAAENGLFLIDNKNEIVAFYDTDKTKKNYFPTENFTDVFESDSIVWLTTNVNGLYKWNRLSNSLKRYGIEEGMPSNVLYRMEEDQDKNIWISSENGLICFNPQKELINTYYEKDGISHNEFNRMSSFKAKDGRLFFGGLNGVTSFYPREVNKQLYHAEIPLQIISYQQFSAKQNELLDLTAELLANNTITLNPYDQFFNIEYRLLDYENKSVRYAYRIEGQHKEWIYTNESSIRISGLPYGNYTLHIKAQSPNGIWSKHELKIPVKVNVPFYLKWWFLILMVLALVSSVLFFVRYRTQRLVKDKLNLEQVVNKRTTQLQKTLEERELLLKEIHHRVKNNLQIISGLLDLQKEEIEAEESKAVFNEGQSRVKSIALIHQNLYQNDNLANIRFGDFIKDMCVQVGEVFEQLNSKMKIDLHVPDVLLDIDTAVPMALIVNELLTNAFKYATTKNKTGLILIYLEDYKNGNYALTFKDDGPGIHKGINFDTASTLGLRLIRGLAAQLYGEAVYRFNNGSEFTITFKDSATRKLE